MGVIEDPNGTNDAEFNSKRFGLFSFQRRDTKLDLILAIKSLLKGNLMYFVNRQSVELSDIEPNFRI